MARLQSLHKEILLKKEILDKARTQLKKEFIGIDQVIDEVINNISSWYFFPSLQSKPVIINLWGLTGVGKSSLVKRIAALTSFDEKYYQFDLRASKEREWEIKSQLENIYENVNGYPIIITLDEFQHARTLDETGKEMDKTVSGYPAFLPC
jgi:predicted AAA+ superfamily ATPase